MNERVKELAEQAQQYAEYTTSQGLEWLPAFKEKFAELIVKECAKAAGDFEYARLHDSLVEDHVLKHFGVEE